MSTTSPSHRLLRFLGGLPLTVAVLVGINAVSVFLVALGNITDYDTNHAFVRHVLSMDTTNFGGTAGEGLDQDVMWRAITDPVAWNVAYVAIIVWEAAAALVLVVAIVLWVRGFTRHDFRSARAVSSVGLLMIVLLFFGVFLTVGGEWFSMWRSTAWNGLDPAFRTAMMAGITLVLVHVPVAGWSRRRRTGDDPADHDAAL